MKKLFMVLLALLLINGAYIMEGGALPALFYAPSVLAPLLLGTFLTTLFSYSIVEIRSAFRDAFAKDLESDRLTAYHIDLLIIKNMASGLLFWAVTIVVLGLILILTHLETPSRLGPSVAVTFLSLLHGFGLRAILLNPMEHSIQKKILLAEQSGKM